MDRAGWKLEALADPEPHGLLVGFGEASNAGPVIQHQMQQPDGLKKIGVVGVIEKLFLKRTQGVAHRTSCAPTRTGHRFRTPFRCRERAVRRLYEFTELYSPKKRSSTEAKRYTPDPANCSSSNSISRSKPRQKATPVSNSTRLTELSLFSAVMPAMRFRTSSSPVNV